jgi:Flp pilus assembly protein TadD
MYDLNRAVELHRTGRLDEAESLLANALKAQPRHADALHLLGLVAYSRGAFDRAQKHIEKAIRIDRRNAAYHSNLGLVLQGMGRVALAVNHFKNAVKLKWDHGEAYCNLGFALRAMGKPIDAVAALRRAIALRPMYPQAINNLGLVFWDAADSDRAARLFRRAFAGAQDFVAARRNLGMLSLESQPSPRLSARTFRQCIALQPSHSDLQSDLAGVLIDSCDFSQAMANSRRAVAFGVNPATAHSALIFAMDFMPEFDFRAHQKERRRWYELHGRAWNVKRSFHGISRDPDRRLRIGYVSADFREGLNKRLAR